jgi:hypothetical protein
VASHILILLLSAILDDRAYTNSYVHNVSPKSQQVFESKPEWHIQLKRGERRTWSKTTKSGRRDEGEGWSKMARS